MTVTFKCGNYYLDSEYRMVMEKPISSLEVQ